jgi:4-hydroxythreonine-4-phosphate dehydrogenase
MILVTQGSRPSIGLEVFFKSFLSIEKLYQSHFKLFACKSDVEKTLKIIKVPFSIEKNTLRISTRSLNTAWIDDSNPTLNSLLEALKEIRNEDTLITLPSDKKSFEINGNNFSGYTQFFRHHFQKNELCMTFKGRDNSIGLITDHIAVKDIPTISTELILERAYTVLNSIDYTSTQNILFSGINPHCGEDGLMGEEDTSVTEAIEILKSKYPKKNFFGPLSADTIWKNELFYKSDSFTFFMYHDQGLGVFKTKNQLIGANITLGLDFLRMSVDHGTAPDIAYKNSADYSGCLFVLKEAIKREIGQ